MQIIKTKFKDLKIVKLKKNSDKRGYLKENFRKNKIQSKYLPFSYYVNSKKNVIRGFHFQYKFQQVKYITVLKDFDQCRPFVLSGSCQHGGERLSVHIHSSCNETCLCAQCNTYGIKWMVKRAHRG